MKYNIISFEANYSGSKSKRRFRRRKEVAPGQILVSAMLFTDEEGKLQVYSIMAAVARELGGVGISNLKVAGT